MRVFARGVDAENGRVVFGGGGAGALLGRGESAPRPFRRGRRRRLRRAATGAEGVGEEEGGGEQLDKDASACGGETLWPPPAPATPSRTANCSNRKRPHAHPAHWVTRPALFSPRGRNSMSSSMSPAHLCGGRQSSDANGVAAASWRVVVLCARSARCSFGRRRKLAASLLCGCGGCGGGSASDTPAKQYAATARGARERSLNLADQLLSE